MPKIIRKNRLIILKIDRCMMPSTGITKMESELSLKGASFKFPCKIAFFNPNV